jgi:hypothetical protein
MHELKSDAVNERQIVRCLATSLRDVPLYRDTQDVRKDA